MTPERRERAEQVAEMRAEGVPFSAIAERLGISKSTAHKDFYAVMYEHRGTVAREFMGEVQSHYRDLTRLAMGRAGEAPTLANLRTAAQVLETAAKAHGVFEPDLPAEPGDESRAGAEFVDLLEAIRATADPDDEGGEVVT